LVLGLDVGPIAEKNIVKWQSKIPEHLATKILQVYIPTLLVFGQQQAVLESLFSIKYTGEALMVLLEVIFFLQR